MSVVEKELLIDALENELSAGWKVCFNPFHAIPFWYLREECLKDDLPYYDSVKQCMCGGWNWDEVKDLV